MSNRFGGDGKTTFALPDLRGRTAIGSGRGAGLSTARLAEFGGKEKVFISTSQMPSHSHSHTHSGGNLRLKVGTNGSNTETAVSTACIGASDNIGYRGTKVEIFKNESTEYVSLDCIEGNDSFYIGSRKSSYRKRIVRIKN